MKFPPRRNRAPFLNLRLESGKVRWFVQSAKRQISLKPPVEAKRVRRVSKQPYETINTPKARSDWERVINSWRPLDQLVLREGNVKVTSPLSQKSVDLFKLEGKKHTRSMRGMIRALVDAYTELS